MIKKNSTLLGSAASVLLTFSVISYARTYVQDPKPVQEPNRTGSRQIVPGVVANDEAATSEKPLTPAIPAGKPNPVAPAAAKPTVTLVLPAETYTATAYSLRGRTASGKPVARGLIAADPRVLPIGTRVRIDAGEFSGEYLVADTGGMVKGRRVDIWTPTSREAMRFGKRAVRLTVLEFGGARRRPAQPMPRNITTPAVLVPAQQSNAAKK